MMSIQVTQYYDEFLRYTEMSRWQHLHCNIGTTQHIMSNIDDTLMKKVRIYDVVERKYAGFTQLLLDAFYDKRRHPYGHKMSQERLDMNNHFISARAHWQLKDWLYIFAIHRFTGSGIHYGKDNSGYYNSVLPALASSTILPEMRFVMSTYSKPMFTSKGYQIAAFPKPPIDTNYGPGKYFLICLLPEIIRQFYMCLDRERPFRYYMECLINICQNVCPTMRMFWFHWAAFLADIADFFPNYVDKASPFFYGSNARRCLSYLAIKPKGIKQDEFFDALIHQLSQQIGIYPYNLEDVACDFIRWVENYVDVSDTYSHIDLDKVWSSCRIKTHPYGRQKSMLHLKLVDTFNGTSCPTGDMIIKKAGWSQERYIQMVKERNGRHA